MDILLLLFIGIKPVEAQIESQQSPGIFNTVLYEVTSPNTRNVSYLFGTHHAFGKAFFDSLAIANEALASCDLLIKENLNLPGHSAEDIINGRKQVTKWSKFLNRKNLMFIKELFRSSPTDINKLTPAELYVFLNRYFKQQICLEKKPSDTSLTLDGYIGSLATQLSLDSFGLELLEDQIYFINKDVEGMPARVHKKRLAGIISAIQSRALTLCGEIDWYQELSFDLQLNQPCGNALMLTNRNNKWMVELKEYLKSRNCFIAVGLSHLMYECGLINQLINEGYTVEPVRLK